MTDVGDARLPPPKVELFLATAQSGEAFDVWRSALSDLFEVALVGDNAEPAFHGRVGGFHLGDSLTFDNASVAQQLIRGSALARRSSIDHIMLQFQTAGRLHGDYDGRGVDLRAGDVGFLDFARPTASRETDFARTTLIVPRAQLPAAFRDRDLHGLVLDGARAPTRLLGRYMKALWRSAPTLTSTQASVAVEAAFAFADDGAAPVGIDSDRREALVPTLRQMALSYIDDRLASRKLTPEAVARALRLSRASLYRLFAVDGGVQSHILARRLDFCFAALADDDNRSKSIGVIAFGCGFNSEAHFSRAFRQRFGISARDLRAIAREGAAMPSTRSDPAAIATLGAWLRGLAGGRIP